MENEFGRLQVSIGEATKGSGPADEPTMEGYTNDYVARALADLKDEGVDVSGEDFTPMDVTLEAGGK